MRHSVSCAYPATCFFYILCILCTLYPVCPVSSIMYRVPSILYPVSCIVYRAPRIVHRVSGIFLSCILHRASCILYPISSSTAVSSNIAVSCSRCVPVGFTRSEISIPCRRCPAHGMSGRSSFRWWYYELLGPETKCSGFDLTAFRYCTINILISPFCGRCPAYLWPAAYLWNRFLLDIGCTTTTKTPHRGDYMYVL